MIKKLSLRDCPLVFKFFSLLFVVTLFSHSIFAQGNITVTGKVIDVDTKAPLVNVSVMVKGSKNGVVTNNAGVYTITAPTGGKLVFTYLGNTPDEENVPASGVLNVSLSSKPKSMDEIVVVGYGSRKKKDLVGAISVIGSKDIERSTALSPELAMQGQMAGVRVASAGGDPSARPTVRIRGVSTMNSADPLYVIDGIPLAEGGAGVTVDGTNDPTLRTPINIYTIINPNDIESISVLKDASAAAVYGVRAANGVVLITTKTGKRGGKLKVDFDFNHGTQIIPKTYSFLNTQQYTKFYTDAYNNSPQLLNNVPVPIGAAADFGNVMDPTSPKYLGNSPTYDWQDAIINRNAAITNYNVRGSGGTENTLYNFSAGYSKNDAPFKGISSERYSVSSNITSKVGKYIETGMNIRLIQTSNNQVGGSGTNDLSIYKAAPWQPIFDNTNPYGFASLYNQTGPITPGSFPFETKYGRQFYPVANYLGRLATSSNTTNNQSAIGNVFVQIQPVEGLRIKGSYSGQIFNIESKGYTDFDNWQYGETPGNPFQLAARPVAGTRPSAVSNNTSTTVNTIKAVNVDYTKSFGKSNLSVTLDASQQDYTWTVKRASGTVLTSNPDLRYFNADLNSAGTYGLRGKYSLIGYLARVSYNFDNKYYIEGVVRRDGSSRFAPGKQFGTFPSGAVGWRVSKERFMDKFSFVNDLKIRGGYGVLGNEQTTAGWKYISAAGTNPPNYNLGSGSQNNNLGISFPNAANTDLTWEKLYSANIGFDAVLFNDFSVTFDYYHKTTKGIIQSVALPPSSGIQSGYDVNIASVLNRGIELQLGYNKKIGEVGLSFSSNLTTVHNEVTALLDNLSNRGGGIAIGKPIGYLFGYKVGGIFQSQAEIDAWKLKNTDRIGNGDPKPGDMYFQDLYGATKTGSTEQNGVTDSIINGFDQTDIGKTIPGFFYGFSMGADYKGFDISAFFQGVGDVQKFNGTRAAGEQMSGFGRNQWTSVLNAWTPTNKSTTMPRAVYQDFNSNNRFSDRFVESASFFRLQNVTVGYTFPKKILEKTNVLQNLRLFVTGINLFTITKYTGLDPENDNYPSTRQFLVGAKVSF